MPDTPSPSSPAPADDGLTAELERLRAIEQAATEDPWWSDESDQCWRLHGVAARIPAHDPLPEQIVNKQILKAPKHGTPYAEYWPDPADAEFIVTARTAFPRLLAAVEAVLKRAGDLEKLRTGPPSAEEDEAAARGIRWAARQFREAITRELTGKEAGTDG